MHLHVSGFCSKAQQLQSLPPGRACKEALTMQLRGGWGAGLYTMAALSELRTCERAGDGLVTEGKQWRCFSRGLVLIARLRCW